MLGSNRVKRWSDKDCRLFGFGGYAARNRNRFTRPTSARVLARYGVGFVDVGVLARGLELGVTGIGTSADLTSNARQVVGGK